MMYIGGVNNKQVFGLSFKVVKTMKSKKNIWEPVIEKVIILCFVMANASSKQ